MTGPGSGSVAAASPGARTAGPGRSPRRRPRVGQRQGPPGRGRPRPAGQRRPGTPRLRRAAGHATAPLPRLAAPPGQAAPSWAQPGQAGPASGRLGPQRLRAPSCQHRLRTPRQPCHHRPSTPPPPRAEGQIPGPMDEGEDPLSAGGQPITSREGRGRDWGGHCLLGSVVRAASAPPPPARPRSTPKTPGRALSACPGPSRRVPPAPGMARHRRLRSGAAQRGSACVPPFGWGAVVAAAGMEFRTERWSERGGGGVASPESRRGSCPGLPLLKHTPSRVSVSGPLGPAARGIAGRCKSCRTHTHTQNQNQIKSPLAPGKARRVWGGSGPTGPGWPGSRAPAECRVRGRGSSAPRPREKREKEINRDTFLLGNISDGIKGDYISWSAGIYPGSYGLNLLSLRPFYESGRGGYLVYSLDPRANPHAERVLQPHLRLRRSLSALPFSRDQLHPSRPAPGPPSPLRSQTPLLAGARRRAPGTPRRSSACTSAATGPPVGLPWCGPRPDGATGPVSRRCRPGPGCGATLPRRKSPFFCL